MSKSKKWRLSFGYPTNKELALVVIAFIFFWVMDASQNTAQGSAEPFKTMTWWGLSALLSWWVFFILYNIALFFVFARSLRKPATSYKYDVIFGITAFVGLLFILGAGIFAFYGTGDTPIPYFLNIPQITVYHIGIGMQLSALLYFILTD